MWRPTPHDIPAGVSRDDVSPQIESRVVSGIEQTVMTIAEFPAPVVVDIRLGLTAGRYGHLPTFAQR